MYNCPRCGTPLYDTSIQKMVEEYIFLSSIMDEEILRLLKTKCNDEDLHLETLKFPPKLRLIPKGV